MQSALGLWKDISFLSLLLKHSTYTPYFIFFSPYSLFEALKTALTLTSLLKLLSLRLWFSILATHWNQWLPVETTDVRVLPSVIVISLLWGMANEAGALTLPSWFSGTASMGSLTTLNNSLSQSSLYLCSPQHWTLLIKPWVFKRPFLWGDIILNQLSYFPSDSCAN